MKVGNISNGVIVQNFLKAIIDIVVESTSSKHSFLVVDRLNSKLGDKFKFSKSIRIHNNSIEVGKGIDTVNKRQLRSFFIQVINLAGAAYLKNILAKRLSRKQLSYLEYIGLNL